jgi:hypothetical protein
MKKGIGISIVVYLREVLDLVEVFGWETLSHLGEALGRVFVFFILLMFSKMDMVVVSYLSSNTMSSVRWYVDSGASRHVTYDKSLTYFKNKREA